MLADSTLSLGSAKVALFIELLNTLGEARIRVTGSSMLPTIWPGDVLTVIQCATSDVRIGDIALFTRDGRLFAHRVVGLCPAGNLVTQGDSVPSQDLPVAKGEFGGRISAVSRAGKTVNTSIDHSVPGRLIATLLSRSALVSRILKRGYSLRGRGEAA